MVKCDQKKALACSSPLIIATVQVELFSGIFILITRNICDSCSIAAYSGESCHHSGPWLPPEQFRTDRRSNYSRVATMDQGSEDGKAFFIDRIDLPVRLIRIA